MVYEEFSKRPTQCGMAEGFLNPEEKAPLRAALCFSPGAPPHTRKDRFQSQEPSREMSHCSPVTPPEQNWSLACFTTEPRLPWASQHSGCPGDTAARPAAGPDPRAAAGQGLTCPYCSSNPTPASLPRLNYHLGYTHPHSSTAHNSQDTETT